MSLLLKQPDEILRHIVSFAPFPYALNLPPVCKKLRDTCNTNPTFTKKRKIIIVKGAVYNGRMLRAAKGGHLDVVEFFIAKGANNWDYAIGSAATGGHFDLVEFFIAKGADDWDWGMKDASGGGHLDLVKFFIAEGANNWNWGIYYAEEGGHDDIVLFLQDKLDNNK